MPWKYLRPSEIEFSQNSIGNRFHGGDTLLRVFKKLVIGDLTPDDLPYIKVRWYDGGWMAFEGNRRLFLYLKLEEEGLLDEIPVDKFTGYKRITNEDGDIPYVRGNPDIDDSMDDIVSQFGY